MSHVQPIRRVDGTTHSERYLKKLCDRSFMSLWSYSSVFRDQHSNGSGAVEQRKGDGKEVCDLLVVFENHIVIFSDKDCDFPNTGDLKVDWSRWYRRAVAKSAEQIWGAERWIHQYPDRLFIDRACTQPLPISLPDLENAIFHRVVVAHGAAERCREHFGGGSGSLLVVPRIVGKAHYESLDNPVIPFAIGQVDPSKGYVHVLDDTTLDIVLGALDTTPDFIDYLSKKEVFVLSGRLFSATGEEELLAYFMQHFDDDREKGFIFPKTGHVVFLDEGSWDEFARSPRRITQLAANEISYLWDHLIENFSRHLLAGTQYYSSGLSIAQQERLFRFLARENRTRRRMLSGILVEMVRTTPRRMRRTRVIVPSRPGDPHYVFLLTPLVPEIPYENNREMRRNFLHACCMVTKLMYPDAQDIVGIATETGSSPERSEDAFYFDGREWTAEDEAEARHLQSELGILTRMTMHKSTVYEYPDPQQLERSEIPETKMKGRDRNKLCPCGSGSKFKNCCGRVH